MISYLSLNKTKKMVALLKATIFEKNLSFFLIVSARKEQRLF